MANGKTHEKYLRKMWPLVIVLAIILGIITWDVFYTIFTILNFSLCDILDPDADQLGLTKSEGDTLRTAKRFRLGFVGAVWISWWFLYAYVVGIYGRKRLGTPWNMKKSMIGRIAWKVYVNSIGLFRGHRSPASHSLILGTGIRMIWFNLPLLGIFIFLEYYGLSHWWINDYPRFMSAVYWNTGMDIWLTPHIVTQFISWTIGDAVHLWADDMLFPRLLPDDWRYKS